MTPAEFEAMVADDFRARGYEVEDRPHAGDWGVDLIATKGSARVCLQVKMYGGTTRPVNRAMIMELYGAAANLDCTASVIATDGRVLADAQIVADKLGIQILPVGPASRSFAPTDPPAPARKRSLSKGSSFESIWLSYVLPLAGKTLTSPRGAKNQIVKVDWSGVERITSGGHRQRIDIEIFRFAVERILSEGSITRSEINDLYLKRASSGIALILSQVPLFEYGGVPATLRLRQT